MQTIDSTSSFPSDTIWYINNGVGTSTTHITEGNRDSTALEATNRSVAEKLCDQAQEFLKLEENWDDEGAAPIERSTVVAAQNLLDYIVSEIFSGSKIEIENSNIAPGGDGSIVIDFLFSNEVMVVYVLPGGESHRIEFEKR